MADEQTKSIQSGGREDWSGRLRELKELEAYLETDDMQGESRTAWGADVVRWAVKELEALLPLAPQPGKCDCGEKLTVCADCAVADYQAEVGHVIDFDKLAPGAPQQEQTGQWREIETAPKDGTSVLLFFADRDDYSPAGAHRAAWSSGYWWMEGHHSGGQLTDAWTQPTHWMPLPSAPLRREGARQEQEKDFARGGTTGSQESVLPHRNDGRA